MPTIAILDDDSTTREFLSEELMSAGFDVIAHEDKAALYDLLPVLGPDLIITDIISPHTTGYEFLETLKKNARYRRIPVIVVSGNCSRLEARETMMKLGAFKCFDKPFDIADLISTIKLALSNAK